MTDISLRKNCVKLWLELDMHVQVSILCFSQIRLEDSIGRLNLIALWIPRNASEFSQKLLTWDKYHTLIIMRYRLSQIPIIISNNKA